METFIFGFFFGGFFAFVIFWFGFFSAINLINRGYCHELVKVKINATD